MSKTDIELRQEDADARKLARSEFHAPVLLEAGAGTGKTATLVARILVWALGPGWIAKSDELADPDHERIAAAVLDGIVAITFTEKASVEMSERLAKNTREIIKGKAVVGIDPEDLPSPAITEARAKSILAQLDRIHIETIHAFCRRTLAENSLAAGLHPSFELDADSSILTTTIRDVVNEWMAEALGDETDENVRQLLAQRLGPTSWESATQMLVAEGVPAHVLAADPYPEDRCSAVAVKVAQGIDQIVNLALPCLAASAKKTVRTSAECLQSLAEISAELHQAGDVEAICAALGHVDLQGSHKRIAEWSKGGPNKTDTKELEAGGIDPDELKRLSTALIPLLKSTISWNPAVLRPAFRVLAILVDRVRARMQRQGILTFNDLLRECRDLLHENNVVRNRLRERIDQLLVDEVQDTDPLQYDIVRSLAFGDEPRPSLFVVGDPKQTIYGFRNADLGAYDSFMHEIEDMGGKKRTLSVNFRSDPPILAEVERIVAPTMIPEAGLQPRFEKLLCAPDRTEARYCDEGGRRAIEFWNSWARSPRTPEETDKILARTSAGRAREIEARAIAAEIESLHRQQGLPYKSFAILMKATTQQETYLSELRLRGIPYLVEKDKQFFRRREVIDASSALVTVLDCHDQISMLGWLRSSIVGLPDAAILPLWSRGFPEKLARLTGEDRSRLEEIMSLIDEAAAEIPEPLAAAAVARIPRWATLLKKAAGDLSALRWSVQHETVDVFFQRMRQSFAFEAQEGARFLGLHRIANLRRFFMTSQEILARPDLNRAEALRLIRGSIVDALDGEEASPGDETADAVRIMSVHKSKGLDFKQVYFVALHQQSGGGAQSDQVYSRRGNWEFNLFGAATPGFGDAALHAAKVGKAEMVRANYVALTRAANRLVLCGAWPASDKDIKEITDCGTIIDLLRHREELPVDWEGLASTTPAVREARLIDNCDNVAWVLPDLDDQSSAGQRASRDQDEQRPVIRADLDELRRIRAAGDSHDPAPAMVNASELKQPPGAAVRARFYESSAETDFVPRQPEDSMPWANVIGTAVHRVLEKLPLDGTAPDFVDECRRLPDPLLGKVPPAADRSLLLERFDHKLVGLRDSALLRRLAMIGEHVLGREVPLIVRQGDQEIIGSLDMLYRDPETGQMVVVDFKTDASDSESALLEHACIYAAQGRAYCQAVAAAFGLETPDIRFELWFVSADRVVELDVSS